MDLKKLKEVINELDIEESKVIYECNDDVSLYVFRPSKQGASLKHRYDPKKNFQIFMKKGDKEFKPNHLRILLDIHLKRATNPDAFKVLYEALEKVYDGEDPIKFRETLNKLDFPMFLDSAFTNLCCAQLFMSEQDINAVESWKVKPARAYLMGYIRLINSQEREISWILWSATRHAPRKEFLTPPRSSI